MYLFREFMPPIDNVESLSSYFNKRVTVTLIDYLVSKNVNG